MSVHPAVPRTNPGGAPQAQDRGPPAPAAGRADLERSDGHIPLEAVFLGYATGQVKLRKVLGRNPHRSIERLSDEDQHWVRKRVKAAGRAPAGAVPARRLPRHVAAPAAVTTRPDTVAAESPETIRRTAPGARSYKDRIHDREDAIMYMGPPRKSAAAT